MGDVNHLKLVVTGYNSATATGDEFWEFTTALMPTLGAGMDNIHTPTGDFDAAVASLSATGTGWTGSSNFLLEGGVNDIDPLQWLEDQVTVAVDNFLDATSIFKDVIRVREVTVYPMNSAGTVISLPVGPAKANITWTASWPEGVATSGQSLPLLVSYAIGKRSVADIPRGRGRIYPPPIVTSSTNCDEDTGLLTSNGRTALLDSGEAFFEGVALVDNVNNLYVIPCIIGAPWHTAYKVTSLSVDNVFDTQRRRKNQLTSTVSTRALAY